MQEKPRGIRASSKLEPSILIHVETSKGVNFAIGNTWIVFSGLENILWSFGSPNGYFMLKRGN